MSITLVTLTKNGGKRLERLLAWAANRPFDEVKVFVDNTTRDNSYEMAKAAGAKAAFLEVKTIDAALPYCCSTEHIETDWLLYLHDDELMGQWFDQDIERLMASPYDVYVLPRYNLVEERHGLPEGRELRYIPNKPWYPDYAMRLFRPGYLIGTGELHDNPKAAGRISVARPHIFHFDLLDHPRVAREAKWHRYLKQGVVEVSRRRGLPDDHYRQWSLPEEYPHGVAVCDERL